MSKKTVLSILFIGLIMPFFALSSDIDVTHYANQNKPFRPRAHDFSADRLFVSMQTNKTGLRSRFSVTNISKAIKANPVGIFATAAAGYGVYLINDMFTDRWSQHDPNFYYVEQGASFRYFPTLGQAVDYRIATLPPRAQHERYFDDDQSSSRAAQLIVKLYKSNGELLQTTTYSYSKLVCNDAVCNSPEFTEQQPSRFYDEFEIGQLLLDKIEQLGDTSIPESYGVTPQEEVALLEGAQHYYPESSFQTAANNQAYVGTDGSYINNPATGRPVTTGTTLPTTNDFLNNPLPMVTPIGDPTDPTDPNPDQPTIPITEIEQPLTNQQLLDRDLALEQDMNQEIDELDLDVEESLLQSMFDTIFAAMPDLSFVSAITDWYQFSGTCLPYNIPDFQMRTFQSAGVTTPQISVGQHCSVYDSMIRPILNWACLVWAGIYVYRNTLKALDTK